MSKTSYENRRKRNLAMLELKKQDIERRYPDGKIEIDVEGTIKGMSPITVLAIPSELRSDKGNKSPSRNIKISTYDKSGEGAKLLGQRTVHVQGSVMDIDQLIDEKLGLSLSNEDVNADAPGTPRGVNLPHLEEDEEENVANPEEPTTPTKAIEGDDLGRVVDKPANKKAAKVPADNLKEAAEIARRLLGK